MKDRDRGRMIVCQRCKLPGGLPGMPPLKRIGDHYFHDGKCPKVPTRPKQSQIVIPKAGEIIVPRNRLPKMR